MKIFPDAGKGKNPKSMNFSKGGKELPYFYLMVEKFTLLLWRRVFHPPPGNAKAGSKKQGNCLAV